MYPPNIDVMFQRGYVMDSVQILKDLGFSLWQVIVLIIVFIFRNELKLLSTRVSSVKVGSNEIKLSDDPDLAEELVKVKKDIEGGNRSLEEIHGEVANTLHKKSLGALINIKNTTNFLWPELIKLKPKQVALSSEIQLSTYRKIHDNLQLLQTLNLFKFSTKERFKMNTGDTILTITFTAISNDLLQLLAEANHY